MGPVLLPVAARRSRKKMKRENRKRKQAEICERDLDILSGYETGEVANVQFSSNVKPFRPIDCL